MNGIHILDVEAAINWWRQRNPSEDGVTACPEVRALAAAYALMTYGHEPLWEEEKFSSAALSAWMSWYDSTPDTPCIAICSTSQGDSVCKGCGRTDLEVLQWPQMSPTQKRHTWLRITQENKALRFNRYAERAREIPSIQRVS